MTNKQRNNFGELPDERLEQELEDFRVRLSSRLSRRQKKQCKGRVGSINKVLDARRKTENVVGLKEDNAAPISPHKINIGEKLHLDKEITIERVGEKEYTVIQQYYGEEMVMNSFSLDSALGDARFLGADLDEMDCQVSEAS